MNKELARQKTIAAYKDDCTDHARWVEQGYALEDDPRTFGKIIGWLADDKFDADGKTHKCAPFCTLTFDSGKEYSLTFDKSVSFYSELTR